MIVNIPLDQVTVQNMLFNNPPNVNSGQTLTQSVPRPTAQGTLTNSLNNPTLIVHSPTLSGGLLGGLNNLLLNLGIDVNNVNVGANLTCGQTGKAYLVI